MSRRVPITGFDLGIDMENVNVFNSQVLFRSRDLVCLLHECQRFNMALRRTHPACQGREHSGPPRLDS